MAKRDIYAMVSAAAQVIGKPRVSLAEVTSILRIFHAIARDKQSSQLSQNKVKLYMPRRKQIQEAVRRWNLAGIPALNEEVVK